MTHEWRVMAELPNPVNFEAASATVRPEDVRAVALPVLRHRLLLNYRAEADGVTPEGLIARLLEAVPGV